MLTGARGQHGCCGAIGKSRAGVRRKEAGIPALLGTMAGWFFWVHPPHFEFDFPGVRDQWLSAGIDGL